MNLRTSERRQARIKMALQAPSGAGKTYSSLLIAYGITNDWGKIAIIDTENGSADLYAHLGSYNVLSLKPPYSPENYIQAIEICEKAGMEVIIIDSISHCWDFLLDYHASLTGNSFTNWAKVTPRQKSFVDKILQSPNHILATMRVKQDYVLNQVDGKYVPEKVGLKSIQKEGLEYEFAIVLDIDIKHNAVSSKDRTGLFSDKPAFKITVETGKKIKEWCNAAVTEEDIKKQITECQTMENLIALYKKYPTWYDKLHLDFNKRKQELAVKQSLTNPQNISKNGTSNS
jgi:hypothetical protein